jgi:glutamine synthetase
MRQMGFDALDVGVEPEYFLFKDRHSTQPLDEGGYFDLTTLDAGSDVRRETVLALEQLGIAVDTSHHEGGPSQHEIALRATDALNAADNVVTSRITVKEYALKEGWHATFMPKPLEGENGSGMHTHLSLHKDGRNVFFDASDPYGLSDVGRGFIAGQLRHARELSAVFAQWVNSYKRSSRLRGAGVRGVEQAQPVRARPRPAAPARAPTSTRTWSCAAPTRRATPTSRSPRCCTQGSRGSRRATSCPSRWRRTSTT